MTIAELKKLLLLDPDMRTVLQIIRDLDLPEAWLAAGCIRNAIWNTLSGRAVFDHDTDVDVVFFDPDCSETEVLAIQDQLTTSYPTYNWEVRNQVLMHQHSPNTAPYTDTCDAVSKYPETCTAIAARLVGEELEVFAPYGLEDIETFTVRPTPHFQADPERLKLYQHRLSKKNWSSKWSQLKN